MFRVHPTRTSSFRGGGGGGGGGDFLDAVLDSVVFDLDVTLSDSYDTGIDSQKWFNLIASPADGASQSDYDFFRGADGDASTDDPTFNGIIGDDAAYWSFDGGDLFSLVTGVNTTFLANMHKTTGGGDFWTAITWFQNDTTWVNAILSTTRAAGTADSRGVEFKAQSSESVRLLQRGDSSSSNVSSGVASPKNGSHVMLITHSHSTNKTRVWLNETTTSEQSHSFNPTTTDSGLLTIAAYGAGGAGMDTETRMYSIAMGNEYISDTEAADIIAHLETRHNRDYTP